MTSCQEFRPDWASAPGDTIADILQDKGLSVADFADLMGHSPEKADNLLQGRATITIETARRLERVLGASLEFWVSRDYQYRQDISRIHVTDEEWLHELPVGDMVKFGWLKPAPLPADEMAACLRFFAVTDVPAWREAYAGLQEMAAFRTSPSFDSQPASVAAWLRQGEIEADVIECQTWDAEGFQESLSTIRTLTRRKDPSKFIPQLQRLCAETGVAVVVVRAPSGCRASGAVRFLSPTKALLQLSFRYLTDDHFWFTFFHEAGHLILHGERYFFSDTIRGEKSWILEGIETVSPSEEQGANEFAARTLVPSEFQAELSDLTADPREIIRFAVRLRVSPGIVVGQLQHLERIGYNQLNDLKRRFTWED